MTHHPKRNLQIIGKLPIDQTAYYHKLLKQSTKQGLGISDTDTTEKDLALISLQETCMFHGYIPKSKRVIAGYSNPFYVCGAGSIGPHKDYGLGLTANVLVSTGDFSKNLTPGDPSEHCILLAQGKHIEIRIGDVFMLNTNIEHAWITNRRWLILGQAVKIKKAN